MKKITIDDVIKNSKNLSRDDVSFIKKAYEFAKKCHRGQKRKTGEAYIVHPLYAAYFISELGLGRDTIAAALLHDVMEDCNVPQKKIKKEFNATVGRLVNGVTNLRHTEDKKITKSSVENLRRFFIVAAKDVRAVIIKLADRLHNAQTIEGLSPQRQKSYAKEIKYVFSTLSDYLRLGFFKRQFDDAAFRILNPEEYKRIERYLDRTHRRRRDYIKKIIEKITKILEENKVKSEVIGREKSIYAIYQKIQKYLREGKIHSESEYGRIYDNYGFRILVKTKEDCYKVLGIIHSTWHPLTGEFDDYIANPKPNGYQALQTTIFCDKNKISEIQILTFEMNDYNEFGPASHIAYKLSGRRNPLPSFAFEWLKKINIFRRGEEDTDDKIYKTNVFKNNVFVLTPDNEVKKLPKGGTPIDFAYSVHTEIGNKCRGAKVNGKMVPLDYQLQTGDQIEIIIDKNARYPMPKWLEFVASGGTRGKIKHVLREKERKEAIEKGYQKLNSSLKRYRTSFKELYKQRKNEIDILIYKNNARDIDGLLANIGFDLINIEKIIAALFPQEEEKKETSTKNGLISIEGSTQTEYSKAKCCDPKLGDSIIALNTIKRGIRIHKSDCAYVKQFSNSRILEAHWE
ncbi:bifunctional (p)ppGpp synthetase/guanosine-3',5'-bis(diphosphate) 3'-pyrophosphohydrolase [Candidatus Dojkabacteria bacterium]|nr:bifunctional (p)ppGpp synthetase/guanosine-3',5'-bis(diphosphate) 3'-pyrophosphohydrolase [Candidatus Dojkabacteria bacterium]